MTQNIVMLTSRDPAAFRAVVGAQIRDLRLRAGMRQNELARLVGVRPDRLTRYEAGLQSPPLVVLNHLSRAIGRPIDLFFPDTPELSLQEEDRKLFSQMRRAWLAPPEVRGLIGEMVQNLCDFLDRFEETAPQQKRKGGSRRVPSLRS